MNKLIPIIQNKENFVKIEIDAELLTLKRELQQVVAKQSMLIADYKPLAPIPKYVLTHAWVNFITYDNAKEIDSSLRYELKKNDSTLVAYGSVIGEFFEKNDTGKNFEFFMQNIISRNEIFNLILTITMNRTKGSDLWMYQPIVTLWFDDGTILEKKFRIDSIKENENQTFIF